MMRRILATSLLASSSVFSEEVKVYIGTSDGPGIYQAQLNCTTGVLSTPRLAVEVKGAGFIVMHPTKPFLYATAEGRNWKDGRVAAYAVKEDGSLTFLNKQSSKGSHPCHVSVDATGQSLFVANYSGGTVASFKIKDDGSLLKATSVHRHEGSGEHSQRQEGPHPHSVFLNPSNTHLYAPDLGADKIFIYKVFAESGNITPEDAVILPGGGMGPRHMKWSADGKEAYVLTELKPGISVFTVAEKPGGLIFKQTLALSSTERKEEGFSGAEIRLHPNGQFIYVSNRDLEEKGRDTIDVFRTSAHAKGFSRVEEVLAEVSHPRNFNIDPSGRWMLVGGKTSKDIALFEINPETGHLTFTGTKIPLEGDPICFVFQHSKR